MKPSILRMGTTTRVVLVSLGLAMCFVANATTPRSPEPGVVAERGIAGSAGCAVRMGRIESVRVTSI